MQQLTNCYYILNFCSNCRYRCATFGQQFVFDNGSFYDDFSVECRADQTWSAATIPHQCACEYFLQHQLKQDLSLSGSKCVNPPKPDAARKMIVSWNPDYPPAHNEAITYKCDAGQPYNRFESGHRLMWRILWNIAGASGSEFTVLVVLDWLERRC